MPHLDVTILGESATTQAVRDLVDQVLALDAEAPHPAAICIPVDRIVDALADGRGEQQLAAFGTRVAT